jgi:hypothetical protein
MRASEVGGLWNPISKIAKFPDRASRRHRSPPNNVPFESFGELKPPTFALDLIDAQHRDDFPGAVSAAAGMIPGAKGVACTVAEETAASVASKLERYLLNPDHVRGGSKTNWFKQPLASTGKMHPTMQNNWSSTNLRRSEKASTNMERCSTRPST